MPAGLLPVIATGTGTARAGVGLLQRLRASTVIVTIRAVSFTRMRRRPLVLAAVTAIFIAGVLGPGPLTQITRVVLAVVMVVSGAIARLLTFYGRRSAFRPRV
jgi:hypothetical protein